MAHSSTPQSHPICPTCQSDLSGKEILHRFAADGARPLNPDDIAGFYEETVSLIYFLGALAEAAPHAAAAHAAELQDTPSWVGRLSRLAEELAEETVRRLDRLQDAGWIWEKRAERAPATGEEG